MSIGGCPKCGKYLGIGFVFTLRPGQRNPPEPCRHCSILLTGSVIGWVVASLTFAAFVYAAYNFDFIIGFDSPYFLPVSVAIWGGAILIFARPIPYVGRKGYCPRCHKSDALHDWTDDPTCVSCEANLRPGFIVTEEKEK